MKTNQPRPNIDKVIFVCMLTKASVWQSEDHEFNSPLRVLLFFSIFNQTLRVCHALVRSCAIYRLFTVLSLGLNYPQMLSKSLRRCEITQFFYALKVPILYTKFGEKKVFFSLNLGKIISNFQQITKQTLPALARH